MDNLTLKEAYAAMYVFLEKRYNQTKSDDIGGMLGDMSFLQDGSTADPATWGDWLKSIGLGKNQITVTEAYAAMQTFVVKCYSWTDIAKKFNSASVLPDGKPIDSAIWEDWLKCIEVAKAGNVDMDLHLK